MDKLAAMRVFIEVVERGSQSAAAEHMELSRPAVSRHLQELEQWAGARLMHRTTRKLTLSAAGEALLPRCRQVLELVGDMQSTMASPDDAPSGLLRITTSASFGSAVLATALAQFVQRYPAVKIDMQLHERAVNLVEERIDLALRISAELDPNLIARRLSVCHSRLCASPAWLAQNDAPRQISDLARLNCLTHAYYGKSLWTFTRRHISPAEPETVAVSGSLSSNETSSLLQATLAGAGIALLPTYLTAPLLRNGQLIALLPDYMPRELGIYAVYASRRNMSAALRALLDFLADYLSPPAAWDSAPD